MLRDVRFDVVVVGGGTAGCVLAARLSESPDRPSACSKQAPTTAPSPAGAGPRTCSTRALSRCRTSGDRAARTGARSEAVSSAARPRATPACSSRDPPRTTTSGDRTGRTRASSPTSSGPGGSCGRHRRTRHIRARSTCASSRRLRRSGFRCSTDLDDPRQPVGAGAFPANVVDGQRWNAALAYVDPARDRENLEIVGDTLVDRVLVRDGRAEGVVAADGRRIEAGTVVLAAGAYFTPAILMRTGHRPGGQSCGATGSTWWRTSRSGSASSTTAGPGRSGRSPRPWTRRPPPTSASTGSSSRTLWRRSRAAAARQGSWDTHVLSWTGRAEAPGSYEAVVPVFHMKPRSAGRVRLRSTDPTELPLVERGFLQEDDDVQVLVEGIELARADRRRGAARLTARERAPPRSRRTSSDTSGATSETTSTRPAPARSAPSSAPMRACSAWTASSSRTPRSCPRSRVRTPTSRPPPSPSASRRGSRELYTRRRARGAVLHGRRRGERAASRAIRSRSSSASRSTSR